MHRYAVFGLTERMGESLATIAWASGPPRFHGGVLSPCALTRADPHTHRWAFGWLRFYNETYARPGAPRRVGHLAPGGSRRIASLSR